MKLLFDFFPILLFFVAYKFYGIYTATAIAIAASFIQVGFYWLRHRSVELMHVITLVLIATLGGATLFFHNDWFIKWKPTAINWVFALIFFGSQYIGSKPIIQKLMEANVSLDKHVWKKLNFSWVIFFLIMGGANIYVAFHYSTNTWVNFKLFGVLGLTVLFVIAQAIYLTRHIAPEDSEIEKHKS